MKPHLLKVSSEPLFSFGVRLDVMPNFYNQWHYHPELELLYIKNGSGTHFAGNNIEPFVGGELILHGKNVPHVLRSNESGLDRGACQAIVIHFVENFLGSEFLSLPEMKKINELIKHSGRGIKFTGATKETVISLMEKMLISDDMEKLIMVLQVLNILSKSDERIYLSSVGFDGQLNEVDAKRLDRIYNYSLENYTNDISLEEISSIANMSPPSFCRYFKLRTKKTFSQFLLEIRVGQACKLLIDSELSISRVCYESGFNCFSNFNRYFKKIKNLTPKEYQKKYLKSKH